MSWLRPWRKKFAKKQIQQDQFTSSEQGDRERIGDYWDRLLGDDFHDAILEEIERMRPPHIETMVASDFISKGQWIFWTTELFRTEMLNGGFEQFIGNWPGFGRDVSICHRELGLNDLAVQFDEIGSQIAPFLLLAFDETDNHASREAYDELHKTIDASPEAQRLNHEFIAQWDTEGRECTPEGFWSSRLEKELLLFIESNYSEFCSPVRAI